MQHGVRPRVLGRSVVIGMPATASADGIERQRGLARMPATQTIATAPAEADAPGDITNP